METRRELGRDEGCDAGSQTVKDHRGAGLGGTQAHPCQNSELRASQGGKKALGVVGVGVSTGQSSLDDLGLTFHHGGIASSSQTDGLVGAQPGHSAG